MPSSPRRRDGTKWHELRPTKCRKPPGAGLSGRFACRGSGLFELILALLQARMSSRRLPGKVLKPILGKPMILHQIDRIRRARLIEELVLVTSTDASDDELATACQDYGVSVFRGNLDDVLDRFYQAAVGADADHIVRLTGDCPLADPAVIDQVIRLHLDGNFDYTSNAHPPTMPDGLDVEIFRFQELANAWRATNEKYDREHVTAWIYHRAECSLGNLENIPDLSALRWTVDEPEDFEFVRNVYEAIYMQNNSFGMDDILRFVSENPAITELNQHFVRNAGSLKQ